MLSRQGASSLDPEHVDRLERSADLTFAPLTRAPGPHEALQLLDGVDLLAATNLCLPVLDDDLLGDLPTLHGVVLHATGYDHIDLDTLEAHGVDLSVLPDYATGAVAEHAVALLLALATRLHLAHDRGRGRVAADTSLRGVELAGRTLGVLGLGRIGTEVARLGGALGMRVVATDIDPGAVAAGLRAGTAMVSQERLLRDSDAVVVCASHRYGAPPVLGPDELRLLSDDDLLVNVTRAALVDDDAVVIAIRERRLRGYAVDDDVVDLDRDGDLLDEGRILQTGHSAWWRDESLERGRQMWGRHLVAAVEGAPIAPVTWPAEPGGLAR